MNLLKWSFGFGMMMMTLWACSRLKSQPITDDGAKINAPGKTSNSLQAKPAVADLCVKCLLQVIQASKSYQENTASVLPQSITYSVNRIKPTVSTSSKGKTNTTYGLEVDVRENENGEDRKLCSYLYDNQKGTVHLLNNDKKHPEETSNLTPDMLKKIRNNCY
jgi:hypothetical protein